MRIFDEDEKKIIEKIIHGEGFSRNFINLIDCKTNLEGTRIEIDFTNKTATFLFQIQQEENPTAAETDWAIEKQKQLTELIIKYVTLFRYLEKEELAFFFDPAKNNDPVIRFGRGIENLPKFDMSIDDQNVVDLLIKYVHKEIMPSPSLRALEKYDYIPDEERRFTQQLVSDEKRFGRQLTATWVAIGVSFLVGLSGVIINTRSSNSSGEQVKLQIQEMHSISESVTKMKDGIGATLDSISKALEKAGNRFTPQKNHGSK
jgi:hypothetical protein